MAWNHNARNRSAEVRRVNYHEDGPSKSRKSAGASGGNGGNGGNGGGLSPVGKAVIGGVALFCLGKAGLGWIGDTIDTFKSVSEAQVEYSETLDGLENTDENQVQDDLESQQIQDSIDEELAASDKGFIERFDIEAGDVSDILDCIDETIVDGGFEEVKEENIIYLDIEALENKATYNAAVINRLDTFDEDVDSVIFAITTFIENQDDIDKLIEHERFVVEGCEGYKDTYLNDLKVHNYINTPDFGDVVMLINYRHR